MATDTIKLEDIEDKQVKEIFQNIFKRKQILTILLPNGEEVIIQKKSQLKPLPILDGYVPAGWKDAIYK